nr:hypothetical protein [Tanacetum cinerariifolium]
AARRRTGVVIRDSEETATPPTIVHSELKSKDKRKGILVEEPKHLKKQTPIEQDKAYVRELEDELNKTINWDDVIEQTYCCRCKLKLLDDAADTKLRLLEQSATANDKIKK